jgi:hypothetical protein
MAKTGLKVVIAIVLLIVAFFVWAYLHLFLIEVIGLEYSLISIPLSIISYIIIIRFLFRIIDSKNNDAYYSYNYVDMVQGKNRIVKNETLMDDKKQYSSSEYENIFEESKNNVKDRILLIIIIISIILLILKLTGII